MSKIKNKKKFLFTHYKITIFFILILFFIFFFQSYKNNIITNLINYINDKSIAYGLILDKVEVIGTKETSKKSIISLFDEDINKSIFLISLNEFKSIIIKKPWVKKLKIKIDYPSTILIEIEEKIPLAIYKKENQYFYVSQTGKIIEEIKDINNESLIVVSGEGSLDKLVKLLKNLNRIKNFNINSAIFIGNRRWDIIIENELYIKLPEKNYVLALNNLLDVLVKVDKINYDLIEFVDLRIPKKAIVRFYNNDNLDIFNNNKL
tara:strand:- start:3676 stop:4464 length:789 start_codon:yes stop_codon:yes gene_type:complete